MIGPFPVINKLRLILSGFCSQPSLTPFSFAATAVPAPENALVLLELGRHPWWGLTMAFSTGHAFDG